MSILHMLDTDTCSYIIKNRPQGMAEKLAEIPPSQICISAITRAELLYGLQKLAPEHRLHFGVRQFLHIVRVMPWDGECADWYAVIRHQLTTSGQVVGDPDMMIAAHAIALGATLVTNNVGHFKRIEAPLTIVNWA